MSAQDILSALPRLSAQERELIASALQDLASVRVDLPDVTRTAGLHAGAWQVTPDFDAPLSDGFWLGDDA